MNRKLNIHVLFLCVLLSCSHYPDNDENVIGQYNSLSHADSNFFFQFNRDNTFLEVIIDDQGVIKKVKGEWHLLDKKGHLYLSNWIEVDSKGHFKSINNGGTLLISNNTLFFSSDNYSRNFKKE